MKIILWVIATLGLCVFFTFYLLPYLKNKITFWYFGIVFKRMAKKHKRDPELQKQLMDISDIFKKLHKSEKLAEDDENEN